MEARQWQADRREMRAKLECIEEKLPALAKQPRRIEYDLLHVGDEDIKDSLWMVERLERSPAGPALVAEGNVLASPVRAK